MATKTKAPPRTVTPTAELPPDPVVTPSWTTEDRIAHIQALGRKLEEHVRFVAAVEGLRGTSAEARGKAVVAFHERLLALERSLGQILEELRLG